MDRLELPPRLRGGWDQALFLTYGADLAFFESAIYREISAARNIIILADQERLLETLSRQARHRTARSINRSYLVSGVRSEHAMHAKAILLTSEGKGRLLIGSGNLSLQGYASGGELFTQYEFTEDLAEPPAAFGAFWAFVRGLRDRGLLEIAATGYLDRFADRAPWLHRSGQAEPTVWHNLDQPLLAQLVALVDGAPVEELWVLAPFHDRKSAALEELLARLQPDRVNLLVQPRRTSVDPTTLSDLMGPEPVSFLAVGEGNRDPYLHAKLVLAHTADRAICLQGSANLSQVALLRPASNGNVELANVADGPRGAFDYLIEELQPREERDISALELSLQTDSPLDIDGAKEVRLASATLRGTVLTTELAQPLRLLQTCVLLIDDEEKATFSLGALATTHKFDLSPEIASELTDSRSISIRVVFTDGDELTSNHVFPVLLDALDRKLQGSARPADVDRVGDLDLDDEELEELLRQLNSLLMIDDQSIWQAAGRTTQIAPSDDADAVSISYEDIDYELLRQHPKFRQYTGHAHGEALAPLPVQAILRSITAHFEQFLGLEPHIVKPISQEALEEGESDVEEEREADERERQRRRWSTDQRLRRIVDTFLRRYLRGLSSPSFQDVAGPEVMAQNFVIFNHLLWRLFTKEWADADHVSRASADIWTLFWGRTDEPGYWVNLSAEDRMEAERWMEKYETITVVASSLAYGLKAAVASQNDDLLTHLRDTWRFALAAGLIVPTSELLQKATALLNALIPYDPPEPAEIAADLVWLANFDTRERFLAWAAQLAGCDSRPEITRPVVNRPGRGNTTVECLILPGVRLARHVAESIIGRWMRVEKLDYYRVATPAHDVMFFDLEAGTGIYKGPNGDIEDVDEVNATRFMWDGPLSELAMIAAVLDEQAVA